MLIDYKNYGFEYFSRKHLTEYIYAKPIKSQTS